MRFGHSRNVANLFFHLMSTRLFVAIIGVVVIVSALVGFFFAYQKAQTIGLLNSFGRAATIVGVGMLGVATIVLLIYLVEVKQWRVPA